MLVLVTIAGIIWRHKTRLNTIMMARIYTLFLLCFWGREMLAFQNANLIKRHNMETNNPSLQSRTRDVYTSNNHPRAKRRDEVRPGLKQTVKTTSSTANNRKMKRERTVVIMYHKPPNVITSHSNAEKAASTRLPDTHSTRTIQSSGMRMTSILS